MTLISQNKHEWIEQFILPDFKLMIFKIILAKGQGIITSM